MITNAFSSAGNVLLLAFGFGFVIFWHELGHFLAAKWAGVKVEQFAVGFGQALFSWRKGLGFRWGSSQTEFQADVRKHLERTTGAAVVPTPSADEAGMGAATLGDLPTDNAIQHAPGEATDAQVAKAAVDLGVSETEYRLNWIPLGGYVKMLGQDDMRPGEQVADPRSYTSKPVYKRMVIVSAGVIMNVILAGIGFIVLFGVGYRVPEPTVGQVVPGAPAQRTVRALDGKLDPIRPGDTILSLDGRAQADFDKIKLNTPLLIPGEPVPIDVKRAGTDQVDHLLVTPLKATPDSEFPQLGIAAAHTLDGPDPARAKELPQDRSLESGELFLFHPGDRVTAVGGRAVQVDQAYVLTDALQAAGGQPVTVTVQAADGTIRPVAVPAHFATRFGDAAIDFGGLQMLPQVLDVEPTSVLATTAATDKAPAHAGVLPGDVIVDVADVSPSGGRRGDPTRDALEEFVKQAAAGNSQLIVTVLRGGRRVVLPAAQLGHGHPTLGVGVGTYEAEPVVADPPVGSPAQLAQVPAGARLVSVDGKPVHTWFDVFAAMKQVPAGKPVPLVATVGAQDKPFTLPGLTDAQVTAVRQNRLDSYATEVLQPALFDLKAKGVAQAAKLGVGETRDAIVQVYLTVRAMVRGGISPRELSGPVGILAVGYKFAQAGATRLLWFLSIISANLAVMNFLPIPVVDGGLFTFLIIEKLKGSPISQKTQQYAQMVGLVLLLSVFLFATWQDVARIPMLFH